MKREDSTTRQKTKPSSGSNLLVRSSSGIRSQRGAFERIRERRAWATYLCKDGNEKERYGRRKKSKDNRLGRRERKEAVLARDTRGTPRDICHPAQNKKKKIPVARRRGERGGKNDFLEKMPGRGEVEVHSHKSKIKKDKRH